jgi:Zn ribbon nucleic-acid-binding protein
MAYQQISGGGMSESHINTLAIRKAAIEGWEPFRYERIGKDGFLLTGGIPRLLTRGPNKGKKTWDNKTASKVVITDAELFAEKARYTAETGNCPQCYGKGEMFASWHVETGTKHRPCADCGGTGKAAKEVA